MPSIQAGTGIPARPSEVGAMSTWFTSASERPVAWVYLMRVLGAGDRTNQPAVQMTKRKGRGHRRPPPMTQGMRMASSHGVVLMNWPWLPVGVWSSVWEERRRRKGGGGRGGGGMLWRSP